MKGLMGTLLERYVVREIARPAAGVCAILATVFVGYLLGRYLSDVVEGLLPSRTIAFIVLLRTAIALEVLLPITLFLCVVMALSRLHADAEMVAMAALGVSPGRVIRAVGGLAAALAVAVGVLSLFVRPWAYEQSYRLRAQAGSEVDIERIKAGRFYARQRGEYVVFAERDVPGEGRLAGVFVHNEERGFRHVIFAERAYQEVDPASGVRTLVALRGRHYRISVTPDGRDRVVAFQRIEMPLRSEEVVPEYRRKAAPTAALARSRNPMDVAELQWRLTTPLATVCLALLGIPLSRAVPRQGRYARFAAAVVAYAAYYNVKAAAKTWVEQGVVGPIPGLWWVDLVLAALVILLLWRPWPGGQWQR
jgi:lipopolysaccharide export system permease protein